MRKNKPALVDPMIGHDAHDAGRRGIAGIKALRQETAELASWKATRGKPPYVAGTHLDGVAGLNLMTALHQAGIIIDQTTLGDGPAEPLPQGGIPSGPKIAAGRHLSFMTQSDATLATTVQSFGANQEVAIPIYWEYDYAFDLITVWISGAGGAGTTARLGIRNDDGDQVTPGSLLVDAGTIDLSTTGPKTLATSADCPAGRYWLCFAPNAACTCWSSGGVAAAAPMRQLLGANDETNEARWLAFYAALTPGFTALPAGFTWSGRLQYVPHMTLRIA